MATSSFVVVQWQVVGDSKDCSPSLALIHARRKVSNSQDITRRCPGPCWGGSLTEAWQSCWSSNTHVRHTTRSIMYFVEPNLRSLTWILVPCSHRRLVVWPTSVSAGVWRELFPSTVGVALNAPLRQRQRDTCGWPWRELDHWFSTQAQGPNYTVGHPWQWRVQSG